MVDEDEGLREGRRGINIYETSSGDGLLNGRGS